MACPKRSSQSLDSNSGCSQSTAGSFLHTGLLRNSQRCMHSRPHNTSQACVCSLRNSSTVISNRPTITWNSLQSSEQTSALTRLLFLGSATQRGRAGISQRACMCKASLRPPATGACQSWRHNGWGPVPSENVGPFRQKAGRGPVMVLKCKPFPFLPQSLNSL